MNPRVLYLLVSIGSILPITRPATAQDPPVPEQVKQWILQCQTGKDQAEYTKALLACHSAVDALEQQLPEGSIFATALSALGELYQAQGNYAQAELHYLRSLRIREKALGLDHFSVAESLNNLAGIYIAQGNYAHSESLFLRSLRISEKTLGLEHPDVAAILNNLAWFYEEQGNYTQAEPLFLRSLQINEKALGSDHPDTARSLNSLARHYKTQGNYAGAEPLMLRSLRIREKTLGLEHPGVATTLISLADLYRAQGNYNLAEPLFLRSLQIREKALGPEHPDVAECLDGLAILYSSQRNYAQAESLYLRSLRINEKALGPEHPTVAAMLNNLAKVYTTQGHYAQAEPLYLRSLRIKEKAFPEHPNVARSLTNLAELYKSRGDYARAEPLFLRSLRILETALGPEHPDVGHNLNHLAGLALAKGQIAAALPHFERTLGIRERTLRTTDTEARVTALLDALRSEEDEVYSLLLLKNAPVTVRSLALRMSLLRKGRAAEAGLMTGWALQASLSTEDQRARFASWQALRSQHEKLFLHGPAHPDNASVQAHQRRLGELQNQIDNQEHELARASPQLAQWKLPAPKDILLQVAARLPAGSALVEVLRFCPVLFKATGPEENRRASPRYVALILFPDQQSDVVELGDAEQVDYTVGELLVAMRDLQKEPLLQAQALYQKIMAPLLVKLTGVQRIYVSLDGSLNLIPFAALNDGKQYLLDAPYQILYLSSGRDLLHGALGQSQQPALVMADPDFGGKLTETAQSGSRTVDVSIRGLYDGLASLRPLKGARAEGTFVGGLLQVPPLLGAAATEARLRQMRSPSILHVATHGLFLNSAPVDSRGARATMVGVRPNDTFNQVTGRSGDFSLSRSALVLANAAQAAEAPDAANDGLLTAEEARSLVLFGTQLVVLSACDTGRGTVKAGQGVYGLRRAFLAAGAQTVVMSLWPVSDTGTQSLMQRYYRLLLDDKAPRARIGALLEAMKAVKAEHPHPYYWAPFIANGMDAPLQLPLGARPL